MRSIIDMLKAGSVRRSDSFPMTKVGEPDGADTSGLPVDSTVLCVHFTGPCGNHSLRIEEPGADAQDDQFIGEVSVCWRRRPSGILRGAVSFGRTVVCDAVFLQRPGAAHDRDALLAAGISRKGAKVVARLPHRPLLATFARGPVFGPDLIRRTHRLLIAAATPRPQHARPNTLGTPSRWEAFQGSWTPSTAPLAG
jgi:hypothetical protein